MAFEKEDCAPYAIRSNKLLNERSENETIKTLLRLPLVVFTKCPTQRRVHSTQNRHKGTR